MLLRRFSLRDKQLLEKSEVEIMRVDCILLPVGETKTDGYVEKFIDSDQAPHSAIFDLCLHCLHWPDLNI